MHYRIKLEKIMSTEANGDSRDLERAATLKRGAIVFLAQHYAIMRNLQIKSTPKLADVPLYEYLQDEVDFDQLCEDLAKEMEGQK